MKLSENDKRLIEAALSARTYAHAPYSHFTVGAALLSGDGTIYTGSNIENASFGATVCAERVAFFKAISTGVRDFKALALTAGKKDMPATFCTPCGICRQVMAEFCTPDFRILMINEEGEVKVSTLGELFPNAFSQENL